MYLDNPVVWIVLGLLLLGLLVWLAPRFTTQARLDRRRRKNNAPVVSKAHRPMVKFSVKTRNRRK